MDILCFPISLNKILISGHVGQNTQLNLRIVRVNEHAAFPGNKYFSNLPSQFHPDWDILQIRLRTADSSRSCNGLVERGADSSVFLNITCKSVRIGGFQLCQLTVFQNI